jgi:ketosteroid isomerase-like protein
MTAEPAVAGLLDRVMAAWTADPTEGSAFAAVYADPVTVNGQQFPLTWLVERAEALHATFADLSAEIVDRVEVGDRLVVAVRHRGRQVGPLTTRLGVVEPTGRSMDVLAIDILTIRNGRVAEVVVVSDELGQLLQLGALTPDFLNATSRKDSAS